MSPTDLAIAFPEMLPRARRRIRELRSIIKEGWGVVANSIEDSDLPDNVSVYTKDGKLADTPEGACTGKDWWRAAIKTYIRHDPLVKELDLLTKYASLIRPTTVQTERKDLSRVKAFPIQDIFSFSRIRKGSARITACCPFHEDKTPSFVIYTKNNTFHCFSCSEHGDAIAFVMKLTGKSFLESVDQLGG